MLGNRSTQARGVGQGSVFDNDCRFAVLNLDHHGRGFSFAVATQRLSIL